MDLPIIHVVSIKLKKYKCHILIDDDNYIDFNIDTTAKLIDLKNNYMTMKNGKITSVDDNPAIKINNSYMWFKNGKLHRDIRPAYITKKFVKFYQNGKLFNDKGPAVINKEKAIYIIKVIENIVEMVQQLFILMVAMNGE